MSIVWGENMEWQVVGIYPNGVKGYKVETSEIPFTVSFLISTCADQVRVSPIDDINFGACIYDRVDKIRKEFEMYFDKSVKVTP